VFSGYSKMAHDTNELRKGFLAVLSLIALFAVPAAAGIGMVADSLVHVLLGEKWLEVIPIIYVLAPMGLIGALSSGALHLLMASGHPRVVVRLAVVRFVVLVPLLVIGTRLAGGIGAAYGLLVSAILLLPLLYGWLLPLVQARAGDVARLLWRPIGAAAAMAAAIAFWQRLLGDVGFIGAHLLNLLTSVSIGAAAYVASVLLLWRLAGTPAGAEAHVVATVRAKLRGRSAEREGGGLEGDVRR
jgi:PST family polysaccharide transporter